MTQERYGETVIERCAACGAIWLDAGELAQLLAMPGAVETVDIGATADALPGYAGETVCPRDRTRLVLKEHPEQSHIRLDFCQACGGVLLDAGELLDVSEFTLRERLRTILKR